MKKEITRVKIDETVMNYLQRLSFEVNSRKEIIAFIIENHARDNDIAVLSSPIFKKYSEELSDLNAEYSLAKDKVTRDFIPEEYQSDKFYWEADFDNGEIVIEE